MSEVTHQPATPDPPAPFTVEQRKQIAMARRRAGKVRRAVVVAKFDGWTSAIFAASSLMYATVSPAFGAVSWVAAIVGCCLALSTFNCLRGAYLLRKYDARGARWLGFNQIFFTAIIASYCLLQIMSVFAGDNALVNILEQAEEAYGMAGTTDVPKTVVAIYMVVIFASILSQGGAALYYFTRARHVRAFHKKTPPWVIELLAARTI